MSMAEMHKNRAKTGDSAFAEAVLGWYDRHRRHLPWRADSGQRANPYHVWLSEIMLQQTTVAVVKAYFLRFIDKWPCVTDLAAADLDEVLAAWAGLGYYARARNLHKTAQLIAQGHGGDFPASEAQLLALPGIGAYTAAAIAAIAFDQPANPIDGNIERVMARFHAIETPLPQAKPQIRDCAAALVPTARPGDYVQALMDLGAIICTPKSPQCALCPLVLDCAAHKKGRAADLPRKKPKAARPVRQAHIFWLEDAQGRVLMRRRPPRGLLGGMLEFPSSPWQEEPQKPQAVRDYRPEGRGWQCLAPDVRHIFTHFELRLTVWHGSIRQHAPDALALHPDEMDQAALPGLMQKVKTRILRAEADADSVRGEIYRETEGTA